MTYVFLIFEVILSVLYFLSFCITSAFQTEALRHTLNNPASKYISYLVILLTLVPAGLSLWSAVRLWGHHELPLKISWQILICIFCGLGGYGLLILNEKVARTTYQYSQDKKIQSLLTSVKNGSGAVACELVQMQTPKSDEFFDLCKTYLQSLPLDQRWQELQKFTNGDFLTRMVTKADGSFSEQSVIPPAHQDWFLKEFFSTLMEASAKKALDVKQASEDLNLVGGLLMYLATRGIFEPRALQVFKQEELPKIEDTFISRLAAADKASQNLRFQDGVVKIVEKNSPTYTQEAEHAYYASTWFRSAVETFKKLVK